MCREAACRLIAFASPHARREMAPMDWQATAKRFLPTKLARIVKTWEGVMPNRKSKVAQADAATIREQRECRKRTTARRTTGQGVNRAEMGEVVRHGLRRKVCWRCRTS